MNQKQLEEKYKYVMLSQTIKDSMYRLAEIMAGKEHNIDITYATITHLVEMVYESAYTQSQVDLFNFLGNFIND